MSVKSATRGQRITLQNAQTALGAGTALAIPNSFHSHSFYITGAVSVVDGGVTIESATDPSYTGTWNIENNEVSPVALTTKHIQLTGIFGALRARISTVLSTGSVTVEYVGS